MKSAAQAVENYRRGITGFGGYQQYFNCGQQATGGFMAVAACLHNAKKSTRTTESMVAGYQAAAGGA